MSVYKKLNAINTEIAKPRKSEDLGLLLDKRENKNRNAYRPVRTKSKNTQILIPFFINSSREFPS